jgi:pimeloyl-ACP methyl ester carboxylesterase
MIIKGAFKKSRYFKKGIKYIVICYLIILLFWAIFPSCLSFRLSQKEIDKAFAHIQQKPTQHIIEVNGKHINYAEIGNDSLPAVIFVHGSPGSWSAFVDFMKDTVLLSKVKMVSVDRIGFGYSELGEAEKSLENQATYLLPIVEQYKRLGKKVILIGHSLGGPLIVKMAMDYPLLIDHLIIVAGSISPYLEPNEKWFRIPLNFLPIKMLLPKSLQASNKELLYLKPALEKMLPFWKNIYQPVIVIQGNKDILVNPLNTAFAKKMLVHAKKLTFIINDTMNHFVPWSHPQLIKNAIDSALQYK